MPVYTSIQSRTSETEAALLNGVSVPGAADWLNAVPSTNGLRLESRQFQIVAGLRLGASVCIKHTCVCGSQKEASGNTQSVVCAKLKGRHMRHRLANDIVKHSLAKAELPSTLEPSCLCISNAKRPDGLTLLSYSRGKASVWDFTCLHQLAASSTGLSNQVGSTV